MRAYFYTITKNGNKYRATAPYYQWHKVVDYFGVPRESIERGAVAGAPEWEKQATGEAEQ